MQYLNWEPAFIVVRTRVLCMVHVWVTWAICLQLEEWDRFLWNCLHWTKYVPPDSSRNPWQMNFRTLTTCSSCSEVSLFPHKHTQQLNRTSPLWALQEAMQRFLWVAWGKDGVKQVTAASQCSAPSWIAPYHTHLAVKCCNAAVLYFYTHVLGDYRNPVFYSSFESPFLQYVTCAALGFLWHGVSQDRVSKCCHFIILTFSWATSLPWDWWLCLLFARP